MLLLFGEGAMEANYKRNFALLDNNNKVIATVSGPHHVGEPAHENHIELGDIKVKTGMVFKDGVFEEPDPKAKPVKAKAIVAIETDKEEPKKKKGFFSWLRFWK
jgi:hypothetical protein